MIYVDAMCVETKSTYHATAKTLLKPLLTGEPNDPGMISAANWFRLPRFMQRIYALYIRYIRRDKLYAYLLTGLYRQRVGELYKLANRREEYRAEWHKVWNDAGLDFLITAPNALPAIPHGGMKTDWRACGYAFLFNLVSH